MTPPDRAACPSDVLASARALPVMILGQMVIPGLGLGLSGRGEAFIIHGWLGLAITIPILWLVSAALTRKGARPLRWWASMTAVLYGLQIFWTAPGLTSGSALMQALHAGNGALLLIGALVIAAKAEKRRAAP